MFLVGAREMQQLKGNEATKVISGLRRSSKKEDKPALVLS